jgi:hypothetical protein
MSRWEISHQYTGITDVMRMNILNAINIAIDTYGKSEMYKIASDVKRWLETTSGKEWCVIIGERGRYQCASTYYDSKYLVVKELNLQWTIEIFQQIP